MSQISPLIFFSSGKELFSRTYLLKIIRRRTEILISPVWNKILKIWDTLFELLQIVVKCWKNYLKTFLPQEAEAFRNNIEKKAQKPRPKFKKYVCYIFTDKYLFYLQSNASGNCLQKCINFAEQQLKFSHVKGNAYLNIGILQWSDKQLYLKPVWGKRVAMKVKTNLSYSNLLLKAISKFRTFWKDLL